MGDFIRSALNNISSNWSANINGDSNYVNQENEFVGQNIELKGHRLKVEKVLAEGGYGFVFKVKDARSQESYALKRLIASDKESKQDILNEIKILIKLQPHPHIMKFISWGQMEKSNVCLVLCELCSGGSLKDLEFPLASIQQLNRILYQTANAISHLHHLNIIHRDIKVENILFDNAGYVKLCDFGSSTIESHHPNIDWSIMQRTSVEEDMIRKTTPIHRPPEILDTYLHYKINKSMDIWAFGCMIYYIKFNKHAFEDASKLRIINCNYSFPTNHVEDIYTKLIKSCLKVDPDDRITIEGIIEILEDNFVDMVAPCISPKQISPSALETAKNFLNYSNNQSNHQNPIHLPGSTQSFGLSGFTKYLKDTSNKVMQTVQKSIVKQDIDISYLTSSLIVMSYPAEGLESAYRNHSEDVKAFLDSKQCPYLIVNVSGRTYGSYKFGHNIKLINGDESWKDTHKVPGLIELISICDKICDWLVEQKHKKLIIVHCIDGKINSSIIINSFLLYIGMFKNYEASNNFFAVKRSPISLNATQKRYLNYITNFNLKNKTNIFDKNPEKVIIKSIYLNGIPLFSKNREGCRPVLELFLENDKKIFSTLSNEELKVYNKNCDSKIHWNDVNITCDSNNDIYAIISHAKSYLGSRVLQSKIMTIKICCVQFNLTMERKVGLGIQAIKFDIIDLDKIEEVDRYPREFQLVFEVQFTGIEIENSKKPEKLTENVCDVIKLFDNLSEFEECKDVFDCKRPQIQTCKKEVKSSQSSPNLFDRSKTNNSKTEPEIDLLNKRLNNMQNIISDRKLNSNENLNSNNRSNSTVNDLLNLSKEADQNQAASISCDLLGSFDNNTNNASKNNLQNIDLLNDLVSDKTSQRFVNTSNLDLLNELFHTNKLFTSSNSLNNSNNVINGLDLLTEPSGAIGEEIDNVLNPTNIQRNVSTPNLKKLDPLAELDCFLNKNKNESNKNINSNFNTNSYLKPTSSNNETSSKNRTNQSNIPKVSSYSSFNQSMKSKPDYNRTYFNDLSNLNTNQSNNSSKNTNSKISGNEFGDLLSNFPKKNQTDWNSSNNTCNINNTNGNGKSMDQLKKEKNLKAGSFNPLKSKVNDWKDNKKRNIRALLGSLHTIVWPECNWTPIGMHQLINSTDVKKMYRKACLAVHPDKLMGSEHEELAKLIFVELNDAWTEFEKKI